MSWLIEFLNMIDIDAGSVLVSILVVSCFWNINLKINHLKELLGNHVTDTNKKIGKLDTDLNKRMDKLDTDLNKRMDKLDTDLNKRMDKLESKLDQVLVNQSKNRK